MSLRTLVAWIAVAPWAGWAVARLAGLDRDVTLLVPLIAFVPWAAAGAIAATLLALLLRRRAPAVVAAVTAVALVAVIAPRAVGDGDEPERGQTLRVLTINTLGDGARTDVIVDLARRTRADVLSVQELTPDGVEAFDAAGLRRILPHAVLSTNSRASGTGLYARRPLREREGPPQTATLTAAALLRLPGGPLVELHAVHPQAPSSRFMLPRWRRDLRSLPRARPVEAGRVRVLAGDFNATLDHSELRSVIGSGYRDAAASAGAGLRATWPVGRRLPPAVTIDHVLVDDRAAVRDVSVHTIPGTDHRAVFAELVLPRRPR